VTAPIWMAAPPEMHSSLLSSGPGPGALAAAAGAWSSLSAAYAAVAEQLSSLLSAVQAGAWEGPSAEQYVAANVPYLAWLTQASTNSAAAAAQQQTVAVAYTAALAAMPTLGELAANHAVHAVLIGTNFFGINTIPIALNEADYARMWVQAATTMSTYQAVSNAAVAATQPTTPAPQILQADASTSDSSDSGIQPIVDNDSGDPYQASWYLNRITEITDTLGRDLSEFSTNPTQALSQLSSDISGLIADEVGHVGEFISAFQPELTAALLAVTPTPLLALGGFAGLAGLAGLAAVPAVPPEVVTAPAPSDTLPAAGLAPAPAVSASVSAPTAPAPSAPAPTPAPATSPAPAAPAPAVSAAFTPPYVVGPPGIGAGSGMSAGASSSARRKAAEPDIAAAAAAAAARDPARARRRRRMVQRGHGDEYVDMNVEVEPDWDGPPGRPSTVASEQGAGTLGFAGTLSSDGGAQAAGLATLAGHEDGADPTMPMMPGTWHSEDGEGGPAR
jgi:PPE-repeat protein